MTSTTREPSTVSWADVRTGDELPSVSLPVDMRRLVLAAGGGRDLSPLHYDVEFAQAAGNRTAFANTTLQMAFANRVVDDWVGSAGRLVGLKLRMKAPIYLGTTMTSRARVTGTRSDGDGDFADVVLEIFTEDGLCTTTELVVRFEHQGEA
ncbi:hypothetical protein HFP15_24775 [Amycolatopsis sp. K13G38]|uniref:MaoC-like domain-containing protein n=1 Tax=Amycolatopsis acididurans TaxID=2724524 RepID=A0ABX1J8I7_9PSEU|nr:MaoC/PaaZ C-terminal domain-containing protein [Amycolatopsis acididurans]NKQ56097.1 hypothetical protein [Amycolatopsis acididurans]